MFNQCNFSGNLGRDPELRNLQTGQVVCNFSICVNDPYTKEELWVKVTAWGKTATACDKFLKKGQSVIVSGRIKLETYTNKNGEERTNLALNASEVTFISKRNDEQKEEEMREEPNGPNDPIYEDDLPF